jgi:asparagine synthase (glutamine-hydrolysing)
MKVRGLSKKRLLRQMAAELIPRDIVRARKRGFSIPAAAWLRGELEPLARELLAPRRIRSQGFFEPELVTRLLDEHVARRQDHSRQLWGLISFSLWAEQSASAASAPAAVAQRP